MDHRQFMEEALLLAKEAAAEGEVPVGCVIVRNGQIVGRGRNHRETEKTALGHAEIQAIEEACRYRGGWRLPECTLYVTLEPCPMCGGAIINARLPRVVFGAYDKRGGVFGSVIDFNTLGFNHRPEIVGGICEEEAVAVLKEYFKRKR